MSYTKDDDFRYIRHAHDYILTSMEQSLVDDVDRCMHEIKVSACNYAEAVRELDKFRAEQSARRADVEIKAGKLPF